jgi:hypothetical protein
MMTWIDEIRAHLERLDPAAPRAQSRQDRQGDSRFADPAVRAGDDKTGKFHSPSCIDQ